MPKQPITMGWVHRAGMLEPPSRSPGKFYWDTPKPGSRHEHITGFGVRLYPTGKASYVVKTLTGRLKVLGDVTKLTLERAREDARRERNATEPEKAPERTLQELYREHLDSVSRRSSRTQEEYERYWVKHILPVFGAGRLCKDLSVDDVRKLHVSLQSTPYVANKVLGTLRAAFNFALRRKWVTENPAIASRDGRDGIEKFPQPPRRRVFQTLFRRRDLFQQIGQAMATVEEQLVPGSVNWRALRMFRLALLTGARIGELLNLEWSLVTIESNRGYIDLTRAKGDRGNRRGRTIYLSSDAVSLLERLKEAPRSTSSRYVFYGRNPKKPLCEHVANSRAWMKIRAALPPELRVLRPYDLRHLFVSTGARNAPLHLIGDLAGHQNPATTEIYRSSHEETLVELAEDLGSSIAKELNLHPEDPGGEVH